MRFRRPFAVSIVASLVAGAAALGCRSSDVTGPGPSPALTALPRSLTAAEQDVHGAANAFSFALWSQINQTSRDSNVVVAPLSASFALGMALNGAATQTFDEMQSALQFGATPLADIDAGYKSLIALLTGLDPATTMQIANSIWYRNTFAFNQSFLSDDSNYFDATINPLNFDDVSGSLAAVNGWVNSKTHGKIPSIIDAIDPSNVMFLVNAIYFKGTWREPFDPGLTEASVFHAASGDEPVSLMHREGHTAYVETSAFQAVDLPYGDSAFTMTVVLPKPTTDVETVAASMTAATWQSLTAALTVRDVDLHLPKLTLSWQRDLIPDLKSLGMHAAFVNGGADFTRMSPAGKQLFISLLRQKTYVSVDELGTEAAAVTAVGISDTTVEVPTLMRVDRPYLFVIRERLSGTVLFMAKIVSLP